MDKLYQQLKDKIERLTAHQSSKAAYLFAEQAREFSDDKKVLDVLKRYYSGENVTKQELFAAANAAYADEYAAAAAYAAADAATAAANADEYAATAAANADEYAATAAANAAAYAASAAYAAAADARRASADITLESQIAIVNNLLEDVIIDENVVQVCKKQDDVEPVFNITGTTESATISGMQAAMTEQDKHIGLTIQQNLDNKITNLYFSDTGDNRISNDVVKRIAVILCKLKKLHEDEQLSFLNEGIKGINELQKNGE